MFSRGAPHIISEMMVGDAACEKVDTAEKASAAGHPVTTAQSK